MKVNLKKINPTFLAVAGLFVLVIGGGFTILHNKTETISNQNESLALTDSLAVVSEPAVSEEAVPEEVVPKTTATAPSDMDIFAKCLTEKGAELYGASWCPHCQTQKKSFGESIQYVNYIECASDGSKTQAEVCRAAGIKGYPTWQFADGSEILGAATFQQLSEKTSCPF